MVKEDSEQIPWEACLLLAWVPFPRGREPGARACLLGHLGGAHRPHDFSKDANSSGRGDTGGSRREAAGHRHNGLGAAHWVSGKGHGTRRGCQRPSHPFSLSFFPFLPFFLFSSLLSLFFFFPRPHFHPLPFSLSFFSSPSLLLSRACIFSPSLSLPCFPSSSSIDRSPQL